MKSWTEGLPVYGILSKGGDITLSWRLTKPEIFTLSSQQYEALHQTFVKAIRLLPPGTILHLQDWYTRANYSMERTGKEATWLDQVSDRFFNGRPWLYHEAYLHLTKQSSSARVPTSASSGLLKRRLVPEEAMDEQAVGEFISVCGQFVRILTDSNLITCERMEAAALWSTRERAGLIERYCSVQTGTQPVLKDILFTPGSGGADGAAIRIGDQYLQLFTLADAEDLPGVCGPRINYEAYSTERTAFGIGFASSLGLLLPYDHIYNQYLCIGHTGDTIKKLERRRLRLQALAGYSRENAISEEATNAFLNEAVAEQRMPVKAHVNILAWTDRREGLPEMKNRISSALAQLEASPKLETIGAPQIWYAGIPGNAGQLPVNETFDTFVEQAACFFQLESNYRSSKSSFGIRLGDRLTGRPVHVDISDEPMNKLIKNLNKIVVASSGGGKSFFMNHLVRSYYEQGAHIVIVDIGHSYEVQCAYHGGYYFTYSEKDPIRFNPFYLGKGEVLDIDRKESIKALLVAIWKKDSEELSRSEYVTLSNAIQQYYAYMGARPGLFPCFNTFYEFLRDQFLPGLGREGVRTKDFDIENFLYVLRIYYRGGEYDFLLNATENLDLLQNRFIVFALDQIADHPILLPVITLSIMSAFVDKMRNLKGVRKVLEMEETWKAIAKKGMAESIQTWSKTLRKYFGEFIVVTQEVDDIISSPIVKEAIINNSDCKILLDQSKFQNRFAQLQELLGITDHQKTEILSLNKGHSPGSRYRDIWIALGTDHSRVYRLEVSPEEYYMYTSDEKDKVKVWEYIRRYGDVRKGIERLLEDMKRSG